MNRNIVLDILKMVLTFMVVGIHVGFLSDISVMAEYLMVNGLFRIAVPIFLLINGYYFYAISIEKKALDWAKRLLFLYLLWMLFYSFVWLKLSYSFLTLVHMLFIGYFHLWYLPGIIGAGVVVLLLKDKQWWLMILAIAITFIVGVAIQYAGNYIEFKTNWIEGMFNRVESHRNFLLFAFPFFGLGFLINKYRLYKKVSLGKIVLVSVVGIFLLIAESYFNYIALPSGSQFDNYISLIIVCPAIFLLFLNLNITGESKELSKYSTGIYLIHIVFIIGYQSYFYLGGTLLTLIVFISSFGASILLVKINKKLKLIL